MIISLRNITYDELKIKLTCDDKIIIYTCNQCIVGCGIGGMGKMVTLEDALTADGYHVIKKDLNSMGCGAPLVESRKTNPALKQYYEEATAIIALICEDGYDLLKETFPDKKIIKTATTIGVGKFAPKRGVILDHPFESTGLPVTENGYTLPEAAEKLGLYTGPLDGPNKTTAETVNLTVNGQKITAKKGATVLNACLDKGIDVPHLCDHDLLSKYGACRLCVVKIDGYRGLTASCSVPVEEGMNIITTDEQIEEYRKMTLELMVASGDHNCVTCNKGIPSPFGACELQKLVRSYGIVDNEFDTIYDKRPVDASQDVIMYDANKCILCGRCVRACEEIAGLCNLGFMNRGEKTVVVPGLNKTMDTSACVNCNICVGVCPTGALTKKLTHYTGKSWTPAMVLSK